MHNTRDLVYGAVCAVAMTVCAWISIPTVIPITLQTFGIALTLALLGGCRGTVSVLVYLLMGALGLPVFSGMQGGFGVLLGPTGGYLTGFLAMALVYWAVTARGGRKLPACLLGLLACYAFGTAWYQALYARGSLWTVLSLCVFPFIVPDILKIWLALAAAKRITLK